MRIRQKASIQMFKIKRNLSQVSIRFTFKKKIKPNKFKKILKDKNLKYKILFKWTLKTCQSDKFWNKATWNTINKLYLRIKTVSWLWELKSWLKSKLKKLRKDKTIWALEMSIVTDKFLKMWIKHLNKLLRSKK